MPNIDMKACEESIRTSLLGHAPDPIHLPHSPVFRKPEDHPKGWGKEVWLAANDRYCGKLLCFNKGAKFSAHFHDEKSESFYVLRGRIRFIYNDLRDASQHEQIMEEGQVVDIPRLCVHQVEALEESIVIEVSSRHSESDSFRVRPGDSQQKAAPVTFSSTSSDKGAYPISFKFQSPGIPAWASPLPNPLHIGRRANGKLIVNHYICSDDCAGSYGQHCYTLEGGAKVQCKDVSLS